MKTASTMRDRWRLPWPTASLRTYLVAVILLATVPIAALMSYQIFSDVKDQQALLEGNLRQGAAALARGIERELGSSIDALTILSHVDSLQSGDVGQFEHEMSSRRQLRASWASVFLADRDGRVLFDTGAKAPGDTGAKAGDTGAKAGDTGTQTPRAGESIAHLRPFQQLVDRGGPMVSNLRSDRLNDRHATAVAVPVSIDGNLSYVLGAWIDASAWQQLIDQTIALPDDLRSLYDRDYRLIARAPAHKRFVGQRLPRSSIERISGHASGFMRGGQLEGNATYIAWDTVARAGWGVVVGAPAEPVDAAHQRAILAAVGTAAGCLLLGVTLSLLLARRLTRPLRQLATHGAASTFEPIPVQEISLLRDALLAAQAQDEVVRDRLQRKADEFETLFASSPLGLAFAMDPQCRQVLHNPAMTRLFGEPGEAGEPAVQVRQRGQPLPREQQPLQRAAAQGETVTAIELELLAEGEPPRYVIASAAPLRDEHGRPRGAIGAVVDISERKQVEARLLSTDQRLRESQHLMDLAQEAGHVGFLHYHFESDRLAWTPGQAKLFGIDASQSESSLDEWVRRIDTDDRRRVESTLRGALAERRERETFDFRVAAPTAADTRWLSCRVLISYADGGAPQQMIGVTVDVSEQKRFDQERAERVEREQAARLEAEAANRAKDEFLAMLGHELRNPLSAISSAVEVLNRVEATSELARNARSIIARQTRHLAHMMEDLLDVARVISGKVTLSRHPLDLSALVQRAAGTLEVTGAVRDHKLELRLAETWLDADATRIDQVFNNLMTNALKYTPAGGRIEVEVRRDGDQALLVVRDNGIGIPSALLPRVFDLFVQGERALDRRTGGLGIGLTLVKRLVELHGGRIEAASSAAGSTFTLRMPAIEAPASAVREQRHQVPASRRRRITLIEDNEDARDALRSLLELDGHSVSTANDGLSGLESLLQARPDVAVIDIGLPGITGFEVARRSRAAGYAGRMIALSGYGQERDVQQALASGFDAHLVKPVDAQTLRQLLLDD